MHQYVFWMVVVISIITLILITISNQKRNHSVNESFVEGEKSSLSKYTRTGKYSHCLPTYDPVIDSNGVIFDNICFARTHSEAQAPFAIPRTKSCSSSTTKENNTTTMANETTTPITQTPTTMANKTTTTTTRTPTTTAKTTTQTF